MKMNNLNVPASNALRTKIYERINKIANLEEQLAENIYTGSVKSINKSIKREAATVFLSNEDLVYVELDKYCNNKAFAENELNQAGMNFSGLNDFFLLKTTPDYQMIHIDEMSFKLSLDGDYDNIICAGQLINLPKEVYKYIMFLGCSAWSDNLGWFTITYDDGLTEKSLLQLPDFYKRNISDAKMVRKEYYSSLNSKKQERSLYAVNFSLNRKSCIKSIELPNLKDMYIFAITLAR